MNNLTQQQKDAKQAYLNRQAEQMLAHYKNTGKGEKCAVIKHIDSFLETVPKDAKIFWLKFRRKLEKSGE